VADRLATVVSEWAVDSGDVGRRILVGAPLPRTLCWFAEGGAKGWRSCWAGTLCFSGVEWRGGVGITRAGYWCMAGEIGAGAWCFGVILRVGHRIGLVLVRGGGCFGGVVGLRGLLCMLDRGEGFLPRVLNLGPG